MKRNYECVDKLTPQWFVNSDHAYVEQKLNKLPRIQNIGGERKFLMDELSSTKCEVGHDRKDSDDEYAKLHPAVLHMHYISDESDDDGCRSVLSEHSVNLIHPNHLDRPMLGMLNLIPLVHMSGMEILPII